VDDAPWQEVAPRFPQIPVERFRASVQLVEGDGRVYEGAEAVFRALAAVPGRGWPLALYRNVPGFAPLAEAIYGFVARHRNALARLTRWM
jgi:predicted DCC family thiol-disulfide oxidoreductase YuxK